MYNLFCRCYDAMVRCYAKMIDVFWSKHTITSGGNKIYKEIAALICHQEGKLPYAAILGTGTLHRDSEICAHEGSRGHECNHCACDGHAESIVYEGAPKYFMDQMAHLIKEGELSDSIFEKSSAGEEPLEFKLKSNIKFYLMVTDPPCGFIQNQEDPCMEWKVPFVGFPHVPTCSSRILIGATMGIQGYVSHLLKDPILIDSVIILCTKDAEHQRVEFGNSFPLPKIKTRKYNPKDFKSFVAQNLVRRRDLQNILSAMDTSNSTPSENIPVASNISTSDGTKHGSLTMAGTFKDSGSSYLAINPRTGEEITRTESFRITNKYIDACLLNIDQCKEEKRKAIKKTYNDLCKKLTLKNSLFMLKNKLEFNVRAKKDKMESWKGKVLVGLNDTLETPHRLLQLTEIFNKNSFEKKWVDAYKSNVESKIHNIKEEMKIIFLDKEMICSIDDIVSNDKKIIMDCTWHCYFRSTHNTNPTD